MLPGQLVIVASWFTLVIACFFLFVALLFLGYS